MGTTATLGVLALAGAAAAATSSPIGDWARGDGKAWVRIEPCGQKLCAINTWIRPGVTDEKVGDRLVLDVSPQKKRPRFLFRHLKAKGVSARAAASGAYCGKGAWVKSNRPA
ncbi:MAG: hypothetical protein ACLP25_11855, partial [Roseiarcus sp.]